MIIEKGKTSNGYAKGLLKNNATLDGGRYFFMDNTMNSTKANIKISCSIAHPPPSVDSNSKSGYYVNGVMDGITAQLLSSKCQRKQVFGHSCMGVVSKCKIWTPPQLFLVLPFSSDYSD